MARTVSRPALPTLMTLAWLVFHLPLAAQSAQLVDDLQPFQETNPSSETRFLARIGQRAVFEAFKTGVGYQLWSTDGTAQGTEVMPHFTNPTQIGTLQGLAVVVDGSEIFDIDSSFPHGVFLSDGTAAGTRRLPPRSLVVSLASDRVEGGRYFFFGRLGDEPEALWVTDGRPEGLRRVAELGERTISSAKVAAGRLYFLATDRRLPTGCGSDEPPSDCQQPMTWRLWTSDGTAAGTRASSLSATALPTAPPMAVHGVFGETVFVSARRNQPARRVLYGVRAGVVQELATLELDEDHLGPLLSPRFGTLPGGVAFYARSRGAGWELWTSDGTARGTRRASELEAEFAVGELSAPPAATADGRLVFLAAGDPLGVQVWSSDGRPGSTSRLTTLPGFPNQGPTEIYAPVAFDGRVFFTARGEDSGLDLWVTDGTVAGTRIFFESGFGGWVSVNPTVGGNQLFFGAADPEQEGEPNQGGKLWRLQLGAARAVAMTKGVTFDVNTMVNLNGLRLGSFFVFAADDGHHGTEPWIAGLSGNTHLVTDLEPGEGPSSNPMALTRLEDKALFIACQGEQAGLFAATGRPGEVEPLHSLESGCGQLAGSRNFPPPTAVAGGRLFHTADPDALWASDGTTQGTQPVVSFEPQEPFLGNTPIPLAVRGEEVVFVHPTFDAETEIYAHQVWASGGTAETTRRLFTFGPEIRWAEAHASGNRLYLLAQKGDRLVLYSSDGTLAGTLQLAERARGFDPLFDHPYQLGRPELTRLGELDYFRWGTELWRTGGTPDTTESLAGLFPPDGHFVFGRLTASNDALLFFSLGSAPGHRALWTTDGTPAGTRPLLDVGFFETPVTLVPFGGELWWSTFTISLFAGPTYAFFATDGTPEGSRRVELGLGADTNFRGPLVSFDGKLFFSSFRSGGFTQDGELWATDGTLAGTGRAQDIFPGDGASEPEFLLALPNHLLFSANDGVTGRELWAIQGGHRSCESSATALCLGNGRIRAEVVYQDRAGRQHTATAEPLTTEAGAFSFFRAGNLDLFVKVLDGSAVNGNGWVFVGSLSDAGFILTLTDTETGAARRYTNLQGRFVSFGDTQAFDFRGALAQGEVELPRAAAVEGRPSLATKAGGSCVPAAARLCLLDGRFSVDIDWARPGASGEATMQPTSDTSGTFWFFRPENLEGAVKIIDGRPVNGRFWFFMTGLTNLELTISVTDTETGQSKTYFKPRGTFAAFGDTAGL